MGNIILTRSIVESFFSTFSKPLYSCLDDIYSYIEYGNSKRRRVMLSTKNMCVSPLFPDVSISNTSTAHNPTVYSAFERLLLSAVCVCAIADITHVKNGIRNEWTAEGIERRKKRN